MKTRLFFGAPPTRGCLSFENVEATERWLEDRTANPAVLVGEGMVGTIIKRCVCGAMGMDGRSDCYPPARPHRHKIRLQAQNSVMGQDEDLVACDNHVQYYLGKGWKLMAKLCTYCCTREATSDDTCEHCLERLTAPHKTEAQKLKDLESGWCINRDTVLGCITYAQAGTQYCIFCTNHNLMAPAHRTKEENAMGHRRVPKLGRPKVAVRLIPTSARKCVLTTGCAGTMTATVRAVADDRKPEMWWDCPVCRASQKAHHTTTVPSPETTRDILDDVYDEIYGPTPINAEMVEASAHIRAIVHETEGE